MVAKADNPFPAPPNLIIGARGAILCCVIVALHPNNVDMCSRTVRDLFGVCSSIGLVNRQWGVGGTESDSVNSAGGTPSNTALQTGIDADFHASKVADSLAGL